MKPSNWIEGMSMELKQKRKDHILRLFVYLIFIPAGCFTSWWLVWRLVRWLLWSIQMNKWDKVEKRKRAATQADINKLYVSITLWILAGLAYFYFIIMGWHL